MVQYKTYVQDSRIQDHEIILSCHLGNKGLFVQTASQPMLHRVIAGLYTLPFGYGLLVDLQYYYPILRQWLSSSGTSAP